MMDWHKYNTVPEPPRPCRHVFTFLSGFRCATCGQDLATWTESWEYTELRAKEDGK